VNQRPALTEAPAGRRLVRRLAGTRLGWLRAVSPLTSGAIAAACFAGSALYLGATSEHLAHPVASGVYKGYLAAATTLIGALWIRRRPSSRTGVWLVALGVASWGLALQASDIPAIYTIGVIADGPVLIFTFLVCLSFPTGRLQTRLDRILVAATVLALTAFYFPRLLFIPQVQGGGPLSQCVPDCPPNALFITEQAGFVEVLDKTRTYLGLAIAAAILVLFIVRLLGASPARRRTRLTVAVTSMMFLPLFIAFHTARAILHVDPSLLEDLGWALVAVRVIFPLGFLVALIEAELFASRAFRRLLGELSLGPTPERWRDTVADSLGDPSLRLAYWEPSTGRYREPAGTVLQMPGADDARSWVPIERRGEPVAAMTTDVVVPEDPELLGAAKEATLVAVEQGHLESELRGSMARLVEAGDTERRRIQRDIHDSAQQRLVALRVHLELAGERIADRPESRALVERLGLEVDGALAELRTVAHGLYPPLLASRGVTEALRSVSRDGPLSVRISAEGFGRHSAAVEATVYFCCLEALQNATKHAGNGSSVDIRLDAQDSEVRFQVSDNGAGFDPGTVKRGAGLTNIADRVTAAGGTLSIQSTPGRGTRIEGLLPS
jgi:signal transduction histidine kinase